MWWWWGVVLSGKANSGGLIMNCAPLTIFITLRHVWQALWQEHAWGNNYTNSCTEVCALYSASMLQRKALINVLMGWVKAQPANVTQNRWLNYQKWARYDDRNLRMLYIKCWWFKKKKEKKVIAGCYLSILFIQFFLCSSCLIKWLS